MSLPIGVVGGGSFGRSLARAAARVGQRVLLWSRTPRSFEPEESIEWVDDLSSLAGTELLLFAVPSPYIGEVAGHLGHYLDGSHLLVHTCRGLIGDELHTVTEVLVSRTPCRRVGALAGPLVARGLGEGAPSGAIIGSLFPEVIESVTDAIGGPGLRVYGTDDVVGVEVASAFVGLVALALGYATQHGMGPGTLAVLGTRWLAEATRVGEARGAQVRTFAGLAGAGDLLAAVSGDGRPEFEFGKALAEGLDIETAARRADAYIEGAALAGQVVAFGQRHGIKVPLTVGLSQMMSGESLHRVTESLMARPPGRE